MSAACTVRDAAFGLMVFCLLLLDVGVSAWLAETLAPTIRASFAEGPAAVDAWNEYIEYHPGRKWRPYVHASSKILVGCACIIAILVPTYLLITALNPKRRILWCLALPPVTYIAMITISYLTYEFWFALPSTTSVWPKVVVGILYGTVVTILVIGVVAVAGLALGIKVEDPHPQPQTTKKVVLAVDSDSDTCSEGEDEGEGDVEAKKLMA